MLILIKTNGEKL